MMATTSLAEENLKFSTIYSQSGRSVPYNFEDYLKIDFHEWMIIQTLFIVCLRFVPISGCFSKKTSIKKTPA